MKQNIICPESEDAKTAVAKMVLKGLEVRDQSVYVTLGYEKTGSRAGRVRSHSTRHAGACLAHGKPRPLPCQADAISALVRSHGTFNEERSMNRAKGSGWVRWMRAGVVAVILLAVGCGEHRGKVIVSLHGDHIVKVDGSEVTLEELSKRNRAPATAGKGHSPRPLRPKSACCSRTRRSRALAPGAGRG